MEVRSLHISISEQTLYVVDGDEHVRRFSVSTSAWGPGERIDSLCTPRGEHVIHEKIGGDLPVGAVFVGRQHTGEIFAADMAARDPDRDWILTRILWLRGCEAGRNMGGERDSLQRFIYIHGTPDHEPMGVPFSHGCIRMRNADVIELFDLVDAGTRVELVP
jgi:lipoprotein-anchoring transpeptidase ErfK/SrfK